MQTEPTTDASVPKEERQFTTQEMENYRLNLVKFYKEQMSVLSVQLKYEDALTQIEELKLRRAVAQIRHAQLMAPEPEEEDEEIKMPPVPTGTVSPTPEQEPTRKLKKEKA